jgi:hypothetical protein
MINLDPNLVFDWGVQKANLDKAKAAEMRLRKEICNIIFDGQEGKFSKKYKITVDSIPLELKAESKTKLKLDEANFNTLILTSEEDDCFTPTVKMSEAKVRKLPNDSQIWGIITEEPSSPALSFKKVNK